MKGDTIEITVEYSHFKNSKDYSDPQDCPLALALQEKLELTGNWGVRPDYFRIDKDFWKLPSIWNAFNVKKWMAIAKEGGAVEPVSMTLTPVDTSLQQIVKNDNNTRW